MILDKKGIHKEFQKFTYYNGIIQATLTIIQNGHIEGVRINRLKRLDRVLALVQADLLPNVEHLVDIVVGHQSNLVAWTDAFLIESHSESMEYLVKFDAI